MSTQRTRELLERALELAPSERQAFLDEACRDEAELRELRELCAAECSPSLLDESAAKLHSAAVDADERELLVGLRVDRFEIVDVLGRGGTSTVVRARDVESSSDVALKILRRGPLEPEALDRFHSERRVLGQLEHAGIPKLLGAGELPDGRPFLVTECVDGVPIDRFCSERRVDLAARLELFERVCEAVHHAHAHLVIHRDLKPSNILVRADGSPVVLDFGIAKLLDDPRRPEGWTRPGRRAPMTPSYASPEQTRGDEVSTATDVYSLGVILFELLTGARPDAFQGATPRPSRVSARRTNRAARGGSTSSDATTDASRPFEPSALRGDVDTIVLCALHPEPGRRFATVRHFAEDLRRVRAHEPVLARRPSFAYLAGKLARRHPLPAAASIGLLAAGAAVVLVTRASLARVRASESIAWRAHADAVYATNTLAEVLERVAAREPVEPEAVLAVLEGVERRVDLELDKSPEAEGRMRHALGRVCLKLDRTEQAERHTRRALELARGTRGMSSRDVVQNLFLLSEILLARADPRARASTGELVELCGELYGEGHAETTRARALRGRAEAGAAVAGG